MKKKFIFGFIMSAMLVFFAMCASAGAVDVKVNGKLIETDTEPVVVNDRTMVPLRAICESLNCDVAWDQESKGIAIYRKDSLYCMWIDRDTAFELCPSIQGFCVMDVPPMVINDRTMIPLRAFAQLFGAKVSWTQETLTAGVDMDLGELEENEGEAEDCRSYLLKLGESYGVYRAYVNGVLETIDATIELENGKKIELELYPDIAPVTVANFVKLAKEGYYDGLIFHRVIKDFMIQGGGYTTSFENKPADTIKGEFVLNNWYNLIPHDAGTLSMARAADYDSASGQFFIVHKDSNFLDYQYAAFGHVVNGMDIVDEIAQAPTQTIWNGMSDVPVNIPVIKTITIK